MFKEGPPLIIEVYVDGRAAVFVPRPFGLREKTLVRLFQKAMKNGKMEMKNLKPGRYHFNYTEVRRFHVEAELTSAE